MIIKVTDKRDMSDKMGREVGLPKKPRTQVNTSIFGGDNNV